MKCCLCVTKIYHLSDILASNYVWLPVIKSSFASFSLSIRVSDSFGDNLDPSASIRYISGDKVPLAINIINQCVKKIINLLYN